MSAFCAIDPDLSAWRDLSHLKGACIYLFWGYDNGRAIHDCSSEKKHNLVLTQHYLMYGRLDQLEIQAAEVEAKIRSKERYNREATSMNTEPMVSGSLRSPTLRSN